jgi:hypothetical protein
MCAFCFSKEARTTADVIPRRASPYRVRDVTVPEAVMMVAMRAMWRSATPLPPEETTSRSSLKITDVAASMPRHASTSMMSFVKERAQSNSG